MQSMAFVDGWVVKAFRADEISKHTIGQVKWEGKEMFTKISEVREYLLELVEGDYTPFNSPPGADIVGIKDRIEKWKGGKLVIDDHVCEDARYPIDDEPFDKGIPYHRIIVTPVTLKKVTKYVISGPR